MAIDHYYIAARKAGASGGKIVGAGGGGFLLLYCKACCQQAVRETMIGFGLQEMTFDHDFTGVKVLAVVEPGIYTLHQVCQQEKGES
jgi:D-glycero-alpha-D-manno-heptose-7-phosphate kinase